MSAQSDYERGCAELADGDQAAPRWVTDHRATSSSCSSYEDLLAYDINGHLRIDSRGAMIPVVQVWRSPAWQWNNYHVYVANPDGEGWIPMVYPPGAPERQSEPAPSFETADAAILWLQIQGAI